MLNIEPGNEAFVLCYRLANQADELAATAYRWQDRVGKLEGDLVFAQLLTNAEVLKRAAKQIAKQVSQSLPVGVDVKK